MLKASLPKRSQKKPEWLVGVHQIMFSVDLPYFSQCSIAASFEANAHVMQTIKVGDCESHKHIDNKS